MSSTKLAAIVASWSLIFRQRERRWLSVKLLILNANVQAGYNHGQSFECKWLIINTKNIIAYWNILLCNHASGFAGRCKCRRWEYSNDHNKNTFNRVWNTLRTWTMFSGALSCTSQSSVCMESMVWIKKNYNCREIWTHSSNIHNYLDKNRDRGETKKVLKI